MKRLLIAAAMCALAPAAHAQPLPEQGEWARTTAAITTEGACPAIALAERRIWYTLVRVEGYATVVGGYSEAIQSVPLVLGCALKMAHAQWELGGSLHGAEIQGRAVFGDCVQGDCSAIALAGRDVRLSVSGNAARVRDNAHENAPVVFLPPLELAETSTAAARYARVLSAHRTASARVPPNASVFPMRRVVLAGADPRPAGLLAVSRVDLTTRSRMTEIALIEGGPDEARITRYVVY